MNKVATVAAPVQTYAGPVTGSALSCAAMTLTETQASYDRKHAAWAAGTCPSTLDRWVWSGVLRPTLRRSTGSGCGPHLFSADDVRLAAMLNQYMIAGSTLGASIRYRLSEAWYALGPSAYVVVIASLP